MITVVDFANKVNLSVEIILDLCKKLNINVVGENDFLYESDIELLYEVIKNNFVNNSSSNNTNNYFVNNNNNYTNNNNNNTEQLDDNDQINNNYVDDKISIENNQEDAEQLKNDDQINDDNIYDENLDSSLVIPENNIDIDIDDFAQGLLLIENLKNNLSSLKTSIGSISVIPPVDEAVLLSCVESVTEIDNTLNSMSERINKVKNLVFGDELDLSQYFNEEDEIYSDYQWSGTKLTAPMGFNKNGPSGSETWYDLEMYQVVKNMESLYGFTDVEASIREDGVKLLSGKTSEGEEFKNLVMVAADVRHDVVNKNGTFERGQIVETSLGMGIVVDFCEYAYNLRKDGGGVHFDIATAWSTGEYKERAYSKDRNNYDVEYTDQVVPGMKDTTPKVDLQVDEVLVDDQKIDNDVETNLYSSNIQPKNNSDISHRGYRTNNMLDNSAEAFEQAGEKGFWGCEADVRFDSNGELVCSHNAVQAGQNPPTFEQYLDICKEYGMTAIIDLKYEKGVGTPDAELSPAILQTIEDKGMIDSCILQTNNTSDLSYIRENSSDARIWYLTDSITDSNLKLIEDNGVECVNIKYNESANYRRIKTLTDNGVDVCVWNVFSEKGKDIALNLGATYVMSDNVLGITPYQEGEEDFNGIAV